MLWLYSVRYSSLLFTHFHLILACKIALEWHEKSTQCGLFDYMNAVMIN